jgi:hypothetical protein
MPRKAPKRWTVLIYMVADDPQGGELLDRLAVREMDEITKSALSVDRDHINVAVQVDFRTLPGVWRRVIGESTFVRPEGNAAEPDTLYGFFDWVANECPAENYLLIFWGHSRGQFGMFADPSPFEYTAQTLTLDELRLALTAAKRSLGKAVDVIAFKDCFMATLETAYELTGFADYLLASPGLVPVEGWPYEPIFKHLTGEQQGKLPSATRALDAAKGILDALKAHYQVPANLAPNEEVPYSLLSTRGAERVVAQLEHLVGKGRAAVAVPLDAAKLQSRLETAASGAGDPALVDLGVLLPAEAAETAAFAGSLAGADQAQAKTLTNQLTELTAALGNAKPALADDVKPTGPEQLVISHTGQKFGGVSVFVYPSSPKMQRQSRLTLLANEDAYRRLAISTDTNWADVALQSMPLRPAQPEQPDLSAAVAVLEQLQRLGVGMALNAAAGPGGYLGLLTLLDAERDLTGLDSVQASELARLGELARLVAFAGGKSGNFAGKSGNFAGKSGNFAGKSGNFG